MGLKSNKLFCWQCGTPVVDEPMPLSTYAACRTCRALLHVCRLCQFDNSTWRSDCNEPRAESVSDREKANFCDWFKPQIGLSATERFDQPDDEREQLASLFASVDELPDSRESSEILDALFKKD